MGNILRVMLYINPSNDENDANQIVDNALTTCVYSSKCAVNHTMQTSPGALVFQHDMMKNVPLIANLYSIQQRRHHLIDENMLKSTDWNGLENKNVSGMFESISNVIIEYLDIVSPVSTVKIKASQVIREKWVTKGLIVSSQVLDKYRIKCIHLHKEHALSEKYRKYRNLFTE